MKTTLISLLISLAFFSVGYWLIYLALISINPPVTYDGHKYMPFKVILQSGIISLILSIILFIFVHRYFKKKN
ncbi:Uncharacterised protein [Chryseobacterium carnipullorum]|uniref:Uncharacterized protein n=1 Tax=Chryseobacterium carnipullorum TaxID=1124835 RepID=A0A376EMP2_CHRCU|nr:Uncharacterised protein [Chryseobacterium carnipullorum]